MNAPAMKAVQRLALAGAGLILIGLSFFFTSQPKDSPNTASNIYRRSAGSVSGAVHGAWAGVSWHTPAAVFPARVTDHPPHRTLVRTSRRSPIRGAPGRPAPFPGPSHRHVAICCSTKRLHDMNSDVG